MSIQNTPHTCTQQASPLVTPSSYMHAQVSTAGNSQRGGNVWGVQHVPQISPPSELDDEVDDESAPEEELAQVDDDSAAGELVDELVDEVSALEVPAMLAPELMLTLELVTKADVDTDPSPEPELSSVPPSDASEIGEHPASNERPNTHLIQQI